MGRQCRATPGQEEAAGEPGETLPARRTVHEGDGNAEAHPEEGDAVDVSLVEAEHHHFNLNGRAGAPLINV